MKVSILENKIQNLRLNLSTTEEKGRKKQESKGKYVNRYNLVFLKSFESKYFFSESALKHSTPILVIT